MEQKATLMETPSAQSSRFPWYVLPVVILLILAVAFLAYQFWNAQQPAVTSVEGELISAAELEERHGLQVRLIGVTAAGGMIDFRMKIMDAEKAQSFLEDPANLPRLIVAESGLELMTPEGLDDDIEWLDGGILFNFYPNDGNAIEPGTPVIVQFGNVHLEPLPAQ